VFVVFVAAWYVGSYVLLDEDRRFLLPPLHEVVDVGLLDGANRSELLEGLWNTTKVSTVGLFLSITIGMTFAILMSQSRWIERSFYPYAVALQTIPTLALVPVVGFWFGFDFRSRVLIATIISIFPIITNTLFGLVSVNMGHRELFALHTRSRATRLAFLEMPSALPSIFTGLRISAGLSVVGAIVGDFFFRQGERGIGRLLDIYRQSLDSEKLFAAIGLSAGLGLTMFVLVGVLSNRALASWHESAARR
jgi:NitT/TauT family transport system permease protein